MPCIKLGHVFYVLCSLWCFRERGSLCYPGWKTVISVHCSLGLPGQAIFQPQLPEWLGLAATFSYHLFMFFVETGFCHVAQAGLELFSSGDPPLVASQTAGITRVCHHTQPDLWLFILCVCVCVSVCVFPAYVNLFILLRHLMNLWLSVGVFNLFIVSVITDKEGPLSFCLGLPRLCLPFSVPCYFFFFCLKFFF